jgi:hypothetical protein
MDGDRESVCGVLQPTTWLPPPRLKPRMKLGAAVCRGSHSDLKALIVLRRYVLVSVQ